MPRAGKMTCKNKAVSSLTDATGAPEAQDSKDKVAAVQPAAIEADRVENAVVFLKEYLGGDGVDDRGVSEDVCRYILECLMKILDGRGLYRPGFDTFDNKTWSKECGRE